MRFYPKENLSKLDPEAYFELTQELSQIDKNDIVSELIKHPSIYSYYNGLMIMQKGKLDRLNNNLIHFYSSVRKDESDSNRSKGGKATAVYLDDFVNSNSEYLDFKNKIQEEEQIYLLLKSVCIMLDHKKDMLIQLSANLRSETKLYNH
jgi:hypothetical protein